MSDSFSTDGGQFLNPDGTVAGVVRWTDASGLLRADIDLAGTVLKIEVWGTGPFSQGEIRLNAYPSVGGTPISVILLNSSGFSHFAFGTTVDDLTDVVNDLDTRVTALENP